MLHAVNSRILRGDNPFGVTPELDVVQQPRTDVPFWNETWFFSAGSPENEIGFFIHAGVLAELSIIRDGKVAEMRIYFHRAGTLGLRSPATRSVS